MVEEKKAEDKATVELMPILHLPPVEKDRMHSYALGCYLESLRELYNEVPLDQLSDEDLTADEKARREIHSGSIVRWIERCKKDSDEVNLAFYPYEFSTFAYGHMRDLKALLKNALARKAEKARQEAEAKAEEARREAELKRREEALREVAKPLDDAERYLTSSELQEFANSTIGAVDAYLESTEEQRRIVPNIWLFKQKASSYMVWTGVIEDRKKEEARKRQAEMEKIAQEKQFEIAYRQYINRVNAAVEKLRKELAKGKETRLVYPTELSKYEPDAWCDLELPTNEEIHNWAKSIILKRLPEILVNLTRWELTWQKRMLPNTTYKLSFGIPCLEWHFKSDVLVAVNLELKEGPTRVQVPGDYTFEIGFKDIGLKDKNLGACYLGPVNWPTPGSFTTPIALLSLLAKGELEGPGITVKERDSPFITFVIQGFGEELELHDGFLRFIGDITKDRPLAQALLDRKMIDEKSAQLLKGKWATPLPHATGAEITVGQSVPDNREAIDILESLGYKKNEIKEGIKQIMDTGEWTADMSLEEKVRAYFKKFPRGIPR